MKKIQVVTEEMHVVIFEVEVADDFDLATSEEDHPWCNDDEVSDELVDVRVRSFEEID